MDLNQVKSIVIECIADYLETQGKALNVDENTKLVGREAIMDSVGLVNIIVDLEGKFMEEGYSISLFSDKAMSQSQSPFRSIETLSAFIFESIENDNG